MSCRAFARATTRFARRRRALAFALERPRALDAERARLARFVRELELELAPRDARARSRTFASSASRDDSAQGKSRLTSRLDAHSTSKASSIERARSTSKRASDASDASSSSSDASSSSSSNSSHASSRRARMRAETNVNVPNALCAMRIISGPVLAYGYLSHAYPLSVLAGATFAAATDYVDGYVARRYAQGTVLGSYLDPIADKVFVGCVMTAMAFDGALPVWLVALLVARDAAHVAGGAWRRAQALHWRWRSIGEFFGLDTPVRSAKTPSGACALAGFDFDYDEVNQLGSRSGALRPLFIGKVNTAMQMMLIVATACDQVISANVAPEFASAFVELACDRSVRTGLEYAVAASAVAATAEYARIFLAHPGFDNGGQIRRFPPSHDARERRDR